MPNSPHTSSRRVRFRAVGADLGGLLGLAQLLLRQVEADVRGNAGSPRERVPLAERAPAGKGSSSRARIAVGTGQPYCSIKPRDAREPGRDPPA